MSNILSETSKRNFKYFAINERSCYLYWVVINEGQTIITDTRVALPYSASAHCPWPDQGGPPAREVVAGPGHLRRVVQLRVSDEGRVDVDDDVEDAQSKGPVDGAEDTEHVHSCDYNNDNVRSFVK